MGDTFVVKYIKSNFNRLEIFLFAFIVFIYILSNASLALAAVNVTLQWNASSGADGYRLFYRQDGQSYDYGSPDW